MKYCPKCGKENKDDANFCVSCGHNFVTNTDNFQGMPNPEIVKPVSTLGLVSMICGIISLASLVVCCFLPVVALITGPIAVITGIIYLVKHKDQNKNQAILGIVLGAIGLVLGIVILIGILRIDPEAIKQGAIDECIQNPNSDECQMYQKLFPDWFK